MLKIYSTEDVSNEADTFTHGVKAKLEVGGNLINEGKMSLNNTDLAVAKNFIQTGEFKINDPQYIAKSIIEIVKVAKNVSEIGIRVLDFIVKGK